MAGRGGVPRFLAVLALGPLFYSRRAPAVAVLLVIAVLLLTLVTQVGGMVLWACLPAIDALNRVLRAGRGIRLAIALLLFGLAYSAVSFVAVPPLASALGRVPLGCGLSGDAAYGPLSLWTCVLNRHYARPSARNVLAAVSADIAAARRGTRVSYLDAGFPFFDGFPMLPHLSHGDGRKVDIALLYIDPASGKPAPGHAPSPIGYWGYEPPRRNEARPCGGKGSWLRWDFDWLQPLLPRLGPDDASLALLLRRLAESPDVAKVLIEPHLRARFGADHPKIRFQGCAAARHDDHIHIAFR